MSTATMVSAELRPVHHYDHRRENEQRRKQKLPELHCPFGCNGAQVNPNPNGNAECCHLVGHTIDERERVFEPLGTAPWNPEFFATTRRGRQKVSATDIVVNPQVKQLLRTGIHWAKKWASARVYRACSADQAEDWRRRFAKPTDFEIDEALAEEDKDLEIRLLKEKLASLERDKTGEVVEPEGVETANVVPFGPPEPGDLDDAELEELTAPSGAR